MSLNDSYRFPPALAKTAVFCCVVILTEGACLAKRQDLYVALTIGIEREVFGTVHCIPQLMKSHKILCIKRRHHLAPIPRFHLFFGDTW